MKTNLHKTACYQTLDPLIDELRHSLKDFFAFGKTVICSLPALCQRLIEPYHQGFLTTSSRHNERLCLTGSLRSYEVLTNVKKCYENGFACAKISPLSDCLTHYSCGWAVDYLFKKHKG